MRAAPGPAVEAVRPRRPIAVELAVAFLIVGSVTDAIISVEDMAAAATPEGRALAAASIALGLGLAVLGLELRTGQAWLLGVNVIAVAAFIELRSLTAGGILSGAIDVLTVGILLRNRWWFRWTPPDPGAA